MKTLFAKPGRRFAWATVVALLLFAILVIGTNMGFQVGFKRGYIKALKDISEQTGLKLDWEYLGGGKYRIWVYSETKLLTLHEVEFHCNVEHWRNNRLLSRTEHPMTLTNWGKDWIEQQLGGSGGTTTAQWIGVSNSSLAVDVAWTILPDEITTDGLARKQGSYTSTGVGQWNITVTFSVTGKNSTKLYGLYAGSGNTLVAAEQQGTANQKNLESGDSLKVTIQVSVS